MTNMAYLQIFSLLIFIGVLNQVLWTSMYDVMIRYNIMTPKYYIESYLQIFLDIFSGYRNTVRIFYVRNKPNSSLSLRSSLDYFKLYILSLGIAGHCAYNLDSPFGVYLIGHHNILVADIGDFFSQPFLNETRVSLMNFFAGLITFGVTAELIKKKQFNYVSSIVDKYFRHAPAIFGLLVLEFLFPLLFSGPLYSLQSEYAYNKCADMWYRNILLIGNIGNTNGLETCISHTFYSAVDFQLHLIGILIVNMLIKTPRKGIIISASLVVYRERHHGVQSVFVRSRTGSDFEKFGADQNVELF